MDDDTKKWIEEIALVGARLKAVRDVTAILLAYEATRHENADKLFEDITDSMDDRIHRFSNAATTGQDAFSMKLQEATRKELDWIVGAAKKMLSEP